MDGDPKFRKSGFFGRLDERRGYHHGRLKEALLEAARGLLSERGGGSFTLAEAAKRVGVTSAALYRHFADRNALMAELSRRAFELFGQRMAGAWDQGRPDAVSALARMGSAYLAFAREEPGLYASMFSDAASLGREPAAGTEGAAAAKSLDQLQRAVAAALAAKGGPASATRGLALQIWSLSHGVASLVAGAHLDPAWAGCDPETVLRNGVMSLLEQTARPTAPSGPWGR